MAQSNDRAPGPGGRKAAARNRSQKEGAATNGKGARTANGKPARNANGKPPRKTNTKPASARRASKAGGSEARKPSSRGAARPRTGTSPAATPGASSRARSAPKAGRARARARKTTVAPEPIRVEPLLGEEELIEAAKYLPAGGEPRVFEEERFLFPESYGVDRVRLHVKDPAWLFAYWDIAPASLAALRRELGERTLALSRVTLRVVDTGAGGASVILLPPGARSWYVRTAQGRRSYRAELGITLPSGEFRRLAESNTVVVPRGGPSPQKASERRSYRQARALSAAAAAAAARAEAAVERGAEPWSVPPQDAGQPLTRHPEEPGGQAAPGGASDVFRR
jgi:hypothetical protein